MPAIFAANILLTVQKGVVYSYCLLFSKPIVAAASVHKRGAQCEGELCLGLRRAPRAKLSMPREHT